MKSAPELERHVMRIWIVAPHDWQPIAATDTPPRAVALFPAADGCMTARDAAQFILGFNEQMLSNASGARAPRWAVARRVELRLEGDFAPGEQIFGHATEAVDAGVF